MYTLQFSIITKFYKNIIKGKCILLHREIVILTSINPQYQLTMDVSAIKKKYDVLFYSSVELNNQCFTLSVCVAVVTHSFGVSAIGPLAIGCCGAALCFSASSCSMRFFCKRIVRSRSSTWPCAIDPRNCWLDE